MEYNLVLWSDIFTHHYDFFDCFDIFFRDNVIIFSRDMKNTFENNSYQNGWNTSHQGDEDNRQRAFFN